MASPPVCTPATVTSQQHPDGVNAYLVPSRHRELTPRGRLARTSRPAHLRSGNWQAMATDIEDWLLEVADPPSPAFGAVNARNASDQFLSRLGCPPEAACKLAQAWPG